MTLLFPDTISIFEVDPRDPDAPKNGLGPSLYKEWRLTASFAGTGIFKAGNGGYQRMTLIFHGRGLGCTEASHFNAWSLYIHGPLGNYLFVRQSHRGKVSVTNSQFRSGSKLGRKRLAGGPYD